MQTSVVVSEPKAIINRFLTVEFSTSKYFWPREMKMAKKLIAKYSFNFLMWIPLPNGYKVPSLSHFLTDTGKKYLSGQLVEFQKENKDFTSNSPIIQLEENKIGEDVQIVKKPKTLKDFLELYKNEKI